MRSSASVSVPRGFETILLVENDRSARMSARDILKSRGYHVAEVASSRSALATNARHPKRFAALIANVVLPELDGYMLAERLRAERPDLKLLFLLSGPRTPAAAGVIAMRGAAFLHKPFTAVSLSCTLRRLLDDPGRCVVRIPERVSVGVTYPLGNASPGGAALHLGARNT